MRCGPHGTRCRRTAGRWLQCDYHAVASGSWWWWAPYCVPGGYFAEKETREARALKAGVVTRREAAKA
jgi:hypothetical protein